MISLPLLPKVVWGHFPKVCLLLNKNTHTLAQPVCYSSTFNSKSAVSFPTHGETCSDTWVRMCNKGVNMQTYLNTSSYHLHHLLLEVSRLDKHTHTHTLYELWVYSVWKSHSLQGWHQKRDNRVSKAFFGWLTTYSDKLSNTKPTHITERLSRCKLEARLKRTCVRFCKNHKEHANKQIGHTHWLVVGGKVSSHQTRLSQVWRYREQPRSPARLECVWEISNRKQLGSRLDLSAYGFESGLFKCLLKQIYIPPHRIFHEVKMSLRCVTFQQTLLYISPSERWDLESAAGSHSKQWHQLFCMQSTHFLHRHKKCDYIHVWKSFFWPFATSFPLLSITVPINRANRIGKGHIRSERLLFKDRKYISGMFCF